MLVRIVLLVLAIGTSLAAAELQAFTTTHVPNDASWHFAFPAGEAKKYYSDARFALRIKSVSADGVALPVRTSNGLSGHISKQVYAPSMRTGMVYRLMQAQFMFVLTGDPDGELKIGTYEVPMNALRIEIVYRIRYPNGEQSPKFVLTSMSTYESSPR